MAPGIRGFLVPLLLGLVSLGCGNNGTAPSCSYSLSVASFTFGPSGGTGSVTVSSGSTCAWTTATNASWIAVTSGSSGTGSGTVAFTVASNAGTDSRSGGLTIGDRQVTISQDGVPPVSCTLDVSPSGAVHSKDSANGSFTVTTPAGCAWTASSAASWITIAPGSTAGAGSATVTYSVSRNSDTASRSATITVLDRQFAVTQSGDAGTCQYAVSPVQFSPCMTSPQMSAIVTAQSGCTWTSSSTDPWIEIVGGQSGSGSGTIAFRVADNWLAPRSGQILVRWPTVTAGQNIRIAQAGCSYAVTPASVAVSASGGSGAFDVYQQSDPYTCGGPLQNGCVWSAVSAVPWITVTSSMPRAGDDRVSFSVAPNTGPARTGTITVRNQIVRVNQGGV